MIKHIWRKEARNLTDGMDHEVHPLGKLCHYSELPYYLKMKNRIKKRFAYWEIRSGLFDLKLWGIRTIKKWKK